MSEWQPIGTAPKIGGNSVLLWCPDDIPQIVACTWWEGFDPCWQFTDETLAEIAPQGPENPTHWRPLLDPPKVG